MNQIGRRIIELESVDSTNNYVANLLKAGNIDHGTVILAVEQLAGRGQRGAEWQSEPGKNLTFSIFWEKVNLSVAEQFAITRFISLALVETFSRLDMHAKIKWPNDIYIDNLKIAGVLIENQIQGSSIVSSIIGVGINVNQENFGDLWATSIKNETGQFSSLQEILFGLLEVINEQSANGQHISADRQKDYEAALYLMGEFAQYESTQYGSFEGKISHVDESGKLVIETDGELRSYDLKEIQLISRSV